MNIFLRLIPYFFAFLLLSPHYAVAAPLFPRLIKPPIGERWFSISKDKEQTGFNRIEISEAGGGYEIIVESGARMTVLGFSRDASSWERYLVNPDLSLRSFEVDEVIDGKPMKLKGEVTSDGVRVSVTAAGKTKEKILKAKGAVYPPPAVNIYPLIQGGGEPGKSFKLKMLDIEAVKVIGVKITVIGAETLAGGTATVHMQNDLYTFVDNDIWVDHSGNTVKESVRHGLILTQAEDREAARKFLLTHPWLKRR
jgi:hypothetical protein